MTENDAHNSPQRPARRRQSVTAGLAMVLGSSYSNMLLGLVRGIVVMRIIGPTARGLMQTVSLFERYLSNAHLGSLHGLSKELPGALGRNDHDDVVRIEDVGSTVVLMLATLASMGMLVWALLVADVGRPTRITLAIGSGIILAGQTTTLYRMVLRAWGTYSVLALATVITSVGQFVLMLAGAILYGLSGVMWGWLAGMLLTLLYLHFAAKIGIRLRLERATVVRLIKVGLPIAAIVFADLLLRTVDGVLLLKYCGQYRWGLYSMAMQIAAYLYRIPEAGGFVLMPRIWERYSADSRLETLRDYVVRPTLAAGLIMPVLAGFLFIIIPNVVHVLIPKFSPAIYAAQVLAMSAVFLALPVAANGLLIALNEEKIVIFNKLVGALVVATGAVLVIAVQPTFTLLGTELAITMKPSLANLAKAAGSGYAVASMLTLYIVLGRYYRPRWRLWAELAVCYLPLLWVIIALKSSGVTTTSLLGPDPSMWVRMPLRMLFFSILVLPVLWYAERRTGLLRQVRKIAAATLNRHSPPNEEQH